MLLRPEHLSRDPDVLIAMVMAQAAEIEKLRIALKTINGLAFGARSERLVVVEGQMDLDLGDLATEMTLRAANNEDMAGPAGTGRGRTRSRRNIGQLPRHLPRIEEVVEPETTICPCCAGALHRIGEDVAEALDAVPAVLRVIRTIRPKYACRACEGAIVQAPARLRLLEGGMATTALIANVVVWKFAWHMPLNRQARCWLARASIWTGRRFANGWSGPRFTGQSAVGFRH